MQTHIHSILHRPNWGLLMANLIFFYFEASIPLKLDTEKEKVLNQGQVYTSFLCAMHAKQIRCQSTRGPAALFVAPPVEFEVPHLKG